MRNSDFCESDDTENRWRERSALRFLPTVYSHPRARAKSAASASDGSGSFTPVLSLSPGLIIHEGSSVYRIFKRWQAVNQQWKVLNYEKSKDLGDPVSSGGKSGARGSRSNPHGLASSGRGRHSRRLRTILNHHCGYTILHILSQLRPNDPRISTTANREVVMRVTTV